MCRIMAVSLAVIKKDLFSVVLMTNGHHSDCMVLPTTTTAITTLSAVPYFPCLISPWLRGHVGVS